MPIFRLILSLLFCASFTHHAHAEDLGNLSANPFALDSTSNSFGQGSPFAPNGVNNPFSPYGSPFSNQSSTNPFATDQFTSDIQSLASQYDVVIPYFHMGIEYVPTPPDWALQGARTALDAGAAMVVTNHPHLIQGMEVYNGKPIVYSVGNFVFDQMFSNEVRTGTILEIVLQNKKVVGLRPKGVEIVDFHQPRLMTAGEHASLMDRFWASSKMISG